MSIQVEQEKMARLMKQDSSASADIPRPLNKMSSVNAEESKIASTSARIL
jgi:hypothetical protein